jgi:hypothetical protein
LNAAKITRLSVFGTAFKARAKLGDKGDIGDGLVRPKGMHKKTFERHKAEVVAAEAIVDDHHAIMLEAINKRKPKSKRRSFSDQPAFQGGLNDRFTELFGDMPNF